MKQILSLIFLVFFNSIFGQIPAGYYDNAQGLSGYQLKTALSQIITNGHNAHSYNDLYTAYQTSDIDHYYENNGTILDMYSEKPNGPDSYEYSPTSQHCGHYSHEGDCYNREHLLPQSIFNSGAPMKSDAHFVVPSDGYVNNRRSNYPFGEVSNPTWTSSNGSKLGHNTTQGYSGTVFEPIDEFKGDIARMLFYVATRYESRIDGWGNSPMLNHTSDQVFSNWFLQVLLSWSNQDPVSQREIDRNNAVYNYQGNRNPFIDHPEWVSEIWDPSGSVTSYAQSHTKIYPNPIQTGQNLNVTLNNIEVNSIRIFDITGKQIKFLKPVENQQIQMSAYKQGVYFIQINTDKGIAVKKLIVE